MMKAKPLFLTALMAAFVTVANAKAQPQNFGPPPYGGPPVPEFVTAPGALNGLVAVSTPSYTILYDPLKVQQFGGFGSAFFRFTRAHEYAHLIRGHVKMMPSQQAYYDNELEADCDAAGLFGWNSAEVKAAVNSYKQALPPQDMPGMPGYQRRIANMKQCG